MPDAAAMQAEIDALKAELSVMRAQIEWMRKELFGGRKTEKLQEAQMLLKLGEMEKRAVRLGGRQTVSYEREAPKARVTPAENFAHLPVTETLELIPEEVQADPAGYERIGEERTFEVDIIQAQLVKREIVRPKYRKVAQKTAPPVVAPAPARPMAGGYASAGLMAYVALSKYVDHLPLYRLEQMSPRWGAAISRQSMADWIAATAKWLEPIYRRMLINLRQGGYVQADETPIRCNDPDEKRGQSLQGWLWVISRPGGDVVFDWRMSRRHGELNSLLLDYKGLLQSDAYEAYPRYAESHEGVIWLGCWAHCRRKYHEAQSESPKAARVALKLIAQLYRAERQWDEAGITDPKQRSALRQAVFARPLRWLRQLAATFRERVRPQSLLGKACDYTLRQWEPLTEHLRHGETRLDNNLVENAIRPSAVGKNYGKVPVMERDGRSRSGRARPTFHNYRASRKETMREYSVRRGRRGGGGDSSFAVTSAFIRRSASR